jgi:hypothetical protein
MAGRVTACPKLNSRTPVSRPGRDSCRNIHLAVLSTALFSGLAWVHFTARTIARGDERPSGEVEIERTAAIDSLRAAVKERALFDSLVIAYEDDVVRVRSAERPLRWNDWIVLQLRSLDEVVSRQARLRGLTDEELLSEWNEVETWRGPGTRNEDREAALVEIELRGGEQWAGRIAARLDAIRTVRETTGEVHGMDLELVLTLHRMAGRPDPVRLELPAPSPCAFPELPRLSLHVANRGEYAVAYSDGGNYRSGRLNRFHVEVWDTAGRRVGHYEWPSLDEGGFQGRALLAPGASFPVTLPLGHYVHPLPAGVYEARVHYSDSGPVAHRCEVEGAVTVVSERFAFQVVPRVVRSTRVEQRRAEELVQALPRVGPVVVLRRGRGERAHRPVELDTAVGSLYRVGWPAVPALVQYVGRSDIDPVQRGWAFSVLYGITGWWEPPAATLGAYEVYDEVGDIGVARGASGGFRAGSARISEPAQKALAAEWARFVGGVTVEVR